MSGKFERRVRRQSLASQARREQRQFARQVAAVMQKTAEKRVARARRSEVVKDILMFSVVIAAFIVMFLLLGLAFS